MLDGKDFSFDFHATEAESIVLIGREHVRLLFFLTLVFKTNLCACTRMVISRHVIPNRVLTNS